MIERVLNSYNVNLSDLFITIISSGVLLLTVIFTNLITLLINRRNIRLSRKQFQVSMNEQRDQLEKQIVLQQDIFIQNINNDNEKNRISIMPFFQMNEAMQISMQNGKLIFPMEFVNVGNGTAIGVQLIIDQRVVYKDMFNNIEYRQSEPMSTNVVRVGNVVKTAFKSNYIKGAHEVVFQLKFEDMMQRQYIQKFIFYYEYDHNNEIVVQSHPIPECIKDYEYRMPIWH